MRGSVSSNLLAVGAGVVWALSSIQVKRIRRTCSVDLLVLTAWQMLFGALALAALALLHPSRPIDPSPYFFGALAFNALFATGLAWLLWLYVLQHLSAGIAGLSALGIPLIGALAGWIELGERPSSAELLGMLMIGMGLLLTSLWTLRSNRRLSSPRQD